MIGLDTLKFVVHPRLLACAAFALSGWGASFNAWAVDTVADPLTFAEVSNVEPGTVVTSNTQTVSGIDTSISIRVSGGLYSVNGGAFTSANGKVVNGDTVRLQQTASAALDTSTTAKLSLGKPLSAYAFKVTTRKLDTVPNAFSFGTVKDVGLGSTQTSAPAIITGIDSPATITVTGGSYSINGGEFTTLAGNVGNNAQVRARGTAGGSPNQSTTVSIKIGGVNGTFRITTVKLVDTTPNAFSFAPTVDAALGSVQTSAPVTVTGINSAAPISVTGGFYNINGGPYTDSPGSVSSGDTVSLQVLAAYSFNETRTASLIIGGVTAQYSVSTLNFTADQTVDGFSFDPLGDVPLGSPQVSAAVAVVGINVAVPIVVAGGRYQINGAEFTDQPGMVVEGDQIVAEVQASASAATSSTVTVTIGTVAADFTVTTVLPDREPDAFSFPPAADVEPGSTQTSAPIAATGINTETVISISGGPDGRYSINGGAFTAALGSVQAGDSVVIELTASNDYATTTTATLTIGGISADFSVTTRIADTTPEPFAFAPVTDATRGSLIDSVAIRIVGIDAPTPVSITGGRYSLNGAAYTDADGSLVNGDSISIQVQAASSFVTTTSATISVGGVSADFMVSTAAADITPNGFSFINNTVAFPGLAVPSNPITVSGINAPVTVEVTGGEYSVNGSPYLAMPGPVSNGDVVRVLVVPGNTNGDVRTASLNIGGVSASYSATTNSAVDNLPDVFQFDEVRVPVNSIALSQLTPIRGINVPRPISIAGGSYSINGSAFTSAPSMIRGGDIVQLSAVVGSGYNKSLRVALTVGEITGLWSVKSGFDPTKPRPFVLENATIYPLGSVLPDTVVYTKPVLVGLPGGPAAISVVGGSYSINGQAYTSDPGTVSNNDSVIVRFNASSTYSPTTDILSSTSVTLRIGSSQSTLSVQTTLDAVLATPATHDGCEAHVYRELSPLPLRLFVCYPAGWSSSDRRSAMVLWYGGAFVTGTTVRSIEEVKFWANTHGMVGIAPDYKVNDRFGTYSYVAADDGRAALKWVEENAASLGIDPTRVVVNGTSSGGTIGFFAAVKDAPVSGTAADNPPLRPAAVVSRAGSPDVTVESQVHDAEHGTRFGGYATAISPSRHIDVEFPPVLLIHGDHDDKAAATPGVEFCTSLIKLGRICQFNSKAGIGHALSSDSNTPIVQEDTRVFLLGLGLLPAVKP